MRTTTMFLRGRSAAASAATMLLAGTLALVVGLDVATAGQPTAQLVLSAQAERDALEARQTGFEEAEADLAELDEMAVTAAATDEVDLADPAEDLLVAATLPDPDQETVPVAPAPAQPSTLAGDDAEPVVTGGTEFDLGGVPMSVAAVPDAPAPEQVTVTLADQSESEELGLTGLVLDLADASEPEEAGGAGELQPLALTSEPGETRTVQLGIDYTEFAAASGGDWASRLQLVRIPECFEVTPEADGCQVAPVESVNDTEDRHLSATVEIAAAESEPEQSQVESELSSMQGLAEEPALATMSAAATSGGDRFAVTADVAGDAGDWSATSLGSASEWAVSGATGGFTWQYPMRVPPAPGGLEPDLALSYSAASVDGRTAGANNQTSWIGEGWEMWPGFIERSYVPCVDDTRAKDGVKPNNTTRETADLCWGPENATISFGGLSSELIRDEATGAWMPRDDDGTRIEVKTGGSNGTADGEYWEVTTTDGVRYYFGREDAGQDSAWTVPVYGNHPDEPGYDETFARSSSRQGWRWNLDRVVDPTGNEIHYFYTAETNRYGRNLNSSTISYDRGGYLQRIEYGTNTGNSAAAPARVLFDVVERCLPNDAFDCTGKRKDNANKWPDVPTDLLCSSDTSCADVQAPVFFTTKRLLTVTTQVRDGSSWRAVDAWDLRHRFPQNEDSTNAVLWLNSVQQRAGTGEENLPQVQFRFATPLANRIDVGHGKPPLNRYRVETIRTELGGVINVKYSDPECTRANTKDLEPDGNTLRCFPVDVDGEGDFDWFHKYVTTSISESPGVTTPDPAVRTTYSYEGGAAWAKTSGALLRPKQRTFADFRGYGEVVVTTGEGSSAERTSTRYFRGMGGDIDGVTDRKRFAGMAREVTQLNGQTPVTRTVSTPWRSVTGENSDGVKASLAATRVQETTTYDASGDPVHTTRTTTERDGSSGLVQRVHDAGDISTSTDDICTTYTYAQNASKHLLDRVSRVLERGTSSCTQANGSGELLGDERTFYDGNSSLSAAPTKGLATRSTVHGLDEVLETRTAYDAYGRVTGQWDTNANKTTTAYTPATGAATKTTVTSPDPDGSGELSPHVQSTGIDPAWGVPTKVTDVAGGVTTASYDGMGRLRKVWLPDRPTAESPSMEHTYRVRASVSGVVSKTLNAAGDGYHASSAIFDGLGRQVQAQAESKSARHPGLVATDTRYDKAGRAVTKSGPWFSTEQVRDTFLAVGASPYPSQTDTTYDGAGRVTREAFLEAEDLRWATVTEYDGVSTTVTPPEGGTPSTTVEDAQGRVVSLTQHTGADTHGDLTTRYTHDRAGNLTKVADPEGNEWTYVYDILGREISEDDPDAGTTTTTYTPTGELFEVTDARGVTVRTSYDALDRVTATYEVDGATTQKLTSRVYDTVRPGQLSYSVRHDEAVGDIRTGVSAYDSRGRATEEYLTLPEDDRFGDLAGETYTTAVAYTADGQVATQQVPEVGNLRGETVTTYYDDASMPQWAGGGFGWGTYVANSRYTPMGETQLLDVGNTYGTYVSYEYEEATRRLAGISLRRERTSGSDVDLAYSYDAAGNVTSMVDAPGIGTLDAQCFAYDGLRRLTQAWTPSVAACGDAPSSSTTLGGPGAYWNSYAFDELGNRTGVTERDAQGIAAEYAYSYDAAGGPHAVAAVDVTERLGGASTWSYDYDEAGNTTTRPGPDGGAQSLAWDGEGRLEAVTGDGTAAEFVYTADGDRVVRTEGGETTVYLPGGQEATVTTGGTVEATRFYSFAGATVALRTEGGLGGVESLVADHHGTVLARVHNTTRALVKTLTDPFGNLRGGEAPPAGRGLMNKVVDETTGLTQVGARYYDQLLGRFISVDPIMDLTDPQQWHGYAYANNNPVTWDDPTGLIPQLIDGMFASPAASKAGTSRPQPTDWQHREQVQANVERARADSHRRQPASPSTSGGTSTSSGGSGTGGSGGSSAGGGGTGPAPAIGERPVVQALVEGKVWVDATGNSVGGVNDAYKEKLSLKSKLKINSGDPARKDRDRKTLRQIKDSKSIRQVTKLGRNPLVRRAGVPGAVLGYGASWADYAVENGGNETLAAGQAAIDLGATMAGAAAGAKGGAIVGAAIGAAFGGIGAVPGAVIGAGLGSVIGAVGGSKIGSLVNGGIGAIWGRKQ